MFPFQSHSGFQTWSNQSGFVREQNWVALTNVEDSIISSTSKVDNKKQTEACKSHKEAERRRRQRINAHLSTLRTLLPSTTKTDKASLLAEVVHHVKELRRQAADVARQDENTCTSSGGGGGGSSGTDSWPFPGETDELILTYCDSGERLIKATLCCEDRPGLNRDITRAIGSVRARLVRAEMMTVGGRTKSVLVMEWGGGLGGGSGDKEVLRRALNEVVENRASVYGLGRSLDGNKRPRIGGVLSESLDEDVIVTSLQTRSINK